MVFDNASGVSCREKKIIPVVSVEKRERVAGGGFWACGGRGAKMANIFFDWSAVRVGEGQQVGADSAHSHSFASERRHGTRSVTDPQQNLTQGKRKTETKVYQVQKKQNVHSCWDLCTRRSILAAALQAVFTQCALRSKTPSQQGIS